MGGAVDMERIAIVTGAAGGIGQEISKVLAREGITVVACDINSGPLETLAQILRSEGREVYTKLMDVSNIEQLRQIINSILSELGDITILVNCAGVFSRTPLENVTESEWDRILSVNLKGMFFLSVCLIPSMKKAHWGRIINISSMAGFTGGILSSPAYSVSKAGVTCLTKILARYLAPYGITVNAIAPGPTKTKMTEGWPEAEIKHLIANIPLGRFGLPTDIAPVVRFLVSEEASFITGQTIHVNGGMFM